MGSPNVLLLDEPTNDFDIETLTELEDLLDSYGGTLLIISHDRYFLERVCDTFVGLLGDNALRDLPRGIDQYLEQRLDNLENLGKSPEGAKAPSNAAEQRQLKKDLARLERQVGKLKEKIKELQKEQEEQSFDPAKLAEVTKSLGEAENELTTREEEWLEVTLALES
jgi:ATP-binding cassette subfamily F protein uup